MITEMAALGDWYLVKEHKAILEEALVNALLKISKTVDQLTVVDQTKYWNELCFQFNPFDEKSLISDNFSDAFHQAECAVKDAGGEPIFTQK